MARIETDPNYSSPTFSRATAATDPFKKEDVQNLAAAMSTHVHDGAGKGLVIPFATTIPSGAITSAMIADNTIATTDLAVGSVARSAVATDLSAQSTTSATFVVLPSISVTLTTVAGSDVLVWFVGTMIASNATAVAQFSMTMDGGAFPGLVKYTAPAGAYAVPVTIMARYTPAAGPHTWTIGWTISAGSIQTDTGTYRSILALELKRATG